MDDDLAVRTPRRVHARRRKGEREGEGLAGREVHIDGFAGARLGDRLRERKLRRRGRCRLRGRRARCRLDNFRGLALGLRARRRGFRLRIDAVVTAGLAVFRRCRVGGHVRRSPWFCSPNPPAAVRTATDGLPLLGGRPEDNMAGNQGWQRECVRHRHMMVCG